MWNLHGILSLSPHQVDQHISPYQHVKDPSEHVRNLMAEAGFEDIMVDAKQLRFRYNGIPNLRSRLRYDTLCGWSFLYLGTACLLGQSINSSLSSFSGCEGS